jgi:hypothetical protein
MAKFEATVNALCPILAKSRTGGTQAQMAAFGASKIAGKRVIPWQAWAAQAKNLQRAWSQCSRQKCGHFRDTSRPTVYT